LIPAKTNLPMAADFASCTWSTTSPRRAWRLWSVPRFQADALHGNWRRWSIGVESPAWLNRAGFAGGW